MADGPRERMVASTAALLARNGYLGASFATVITAADAPRGSIYHHFPGGKDELVVEAIRWQADRVIEMLRPLTGRPPVEVVDAFVALWASVLERGNFAFGCSLVGASVAGSGDEVRAEAGRAFRAWTDGLAQVLAAGGMPAGDATDFALAMIAACEGAVVIARATRSMAPLQAVGRQLRDAALDRDTEASPHRRPPTAPDAAGRSGQEPRMHHVPNNSPRA